MGTTLIVLCLIARPAENAANGFASGAECEALCLMPPPSASVTFWRK